MGGFKISDINGFPFGAIVGTVLAVIALELNIQGFTEFRDTLLVLNVDLTTMITFLCSLYLVGVICDFFIIFHGIFVWCSIKEWNMCTWCSFPCCTGISFIGTLVLWIVFILLLAQFAAGFLMAFIFFAIGLTCNKAIDKLLDAPIVNETFSAYYNRSGISTMIQSISDPPINLRIAGSLNEVAEDVAVTTDSFLDAMEKFCDFFSDDITNACLLITIGAFAAICAQVVILVYQSKYYIIWYYDQHYEKQLEKSRKKKERMEGKEGEKYDEVKIDDEKERGSLANKMEEGNDEPKTTATIGTGSSVALQGESIASNLTTMK